MIVNLDVKNVYTKTVNPKSTENTPKISEERKKQQSTENQKNNNTEILVKWRPAF